MTDRKAKILRNIYDALFAHYGPQRWWPGETPFEVCVGAILTQNTNWTNVARAIENLRSANMLSCERLRACRSDRLAGLIRPAGYFNIKAQRLKNFVAYLMSGYGGRLENMKDRSGPVLRTELLGVTGVGPETADSILLYALERPVFVIDAYTRRLLARHGFPEGGQDYAVMQELFMKRLPRDVRLFNEYHALIVRLGKDCGTGPLIPEGYPLKDRKYFL